MEINWSILLLKTISFQLWEESQISNSCLREDLAKVRDELTATRKKLDSSMQVSCQLAAFTKRKCELSSDFHAPIVLSIFRL